MITVQISDEDRARALEWAAKLEVCSTDPRYTFNAGLFRDDFLNRVALLRRLVGEVVTAPVPDDVEVSRR